MFSYRLVLETPVPAGVPPGPFPYAASARLAPLLAYRREAEALWPAARVTSVPVSPALPAGGSSVLSSASDVDRCV